MRYLKDWRLIPFQKLSGIENMAIDEFMIYYYEKYKIPVLRLYTWDCPSISVGKYQNVMNDINIEFCSEEDVYIVRRITGGGAILHNNELTYSFVCSEKDINANKLSVKEIFEKINEFLLEFYKAFNLKPNFAKNVFKQKKFGCRSSFCFADNEEYDIVIKNKKIGGNAQFRKKNIIFQHGSIPFDISEEKIKKYFYYKVNFDNFTCLNRLLKRQIEIKEAEKIFIKAFKKILKANLKEEAITYAEKDKIEKLILKKYGSDEWNLKGEINENKS